MLRAVAATVTSLFLVSSALADKQTTERPVPRTVMETSATNPYGVHRLMMFDGPDDSLSRIAPPPAALSGSTVYLNRCVSGCMIKPGADDMTATPILSQFAPNTLTLSAASDLTEAEWTGIVQCVKEVYSPFDIKITDQEPTGVPVYSGIIVGGNNTAKAAAAFGLDPSTGGFGQASCNPNTRGVAYAFADNDNVNAFAFEVSGNASSEARILGMCWIIAQETAHTFGLDHEFAYQDDGASACNDPMTYRFECGGQKFFRNRFATCGEFKEQGTRPCKCGGNTQNSHLRLANLFGAGTSLIPPPTTEITMPAANSTSASSLGTQVLANAGSARGVGRVELHVNGYKWAETKGAPFGRNGQPSPSPYQLLVPANLPDSIVDIQVKAFDDLELVGESQVVTVVKGKAGGCTAATECAEGQKCEAGKCFWDAPSVDLGGACTFPQECLSGMCSDDVFQGDGICTQSCVVGLEDSCPAGLECIDAGNTSVCFTPTEKGGCCSSSNGSPWGALMLAGVVLGWVARRKKK